MRLGLLFQNVSSSIEVKLDDLFNDSKDVVSVGIIRGLPLFTLGDDRKRCIFVQVKNITRKFVLSMAS